MKIAFDPGTPAEQVGAAVADAIQDGALFVHADGLPFADMNEANRHAYITAAAGAIGSLTVTDRRPGTELWLLDSSTSPNASHIPYHTDNPFLPEPEEVVGFWNVRSSADGGANLIVPAEQVIDRVPAGLKDDLATTPVGFVHGDRSAQASILDLGSPNPTVRFDRKYVQGTGGIALADALGRVLEGDRMDPTVVKLAPGGALFFHNRRVLHARSPYSDPNRLSVRTRSERLTTSRPPR